MSWLFSQALVEEYLEDICLDGEQSVLSNGKPIQQAYCSQDKMMDFCRVSQFGMMFKPLMESLGEELLMLYQEDFHAKTTQQQEGGGELRQNDQECGKKWRESLAKLDPNTLLWKIPQCSLLEDLEQSLEIWPRWGSMRNGECFPQPMLAQITIDKEFGLLERTPNNVNFFHTPNTTGIDGGSNSRKALKKRIFPTPNAEDWKNRGNLQPINTKKIRNWQTNFIEYGGSSDIWKFEPKLDRVVDGMADRVDRLKAIGNGQVPLCAATAWNLLRKRIDG